MGAGVAGLEYRRSSITNGTIRQERGERGIEVNQCCGTTTDQCGGIDRKTEQVVGRR
jgi:hypothetical protein